MSSNGKKEFWSKLLSKYQEKSLSDCHQRLIENTRRVSIIHQLNEVGFDNVSQLDPELRFVILKVEENDSSLNLRLEIPTNFPSEPFSVDSAAEIYPTSRFNKFYFLVLRKLILIHKVNSVQEACAKCFAVHISTLKS